MEGAGGVEVVKGMFFFEPFLGSFVFILSSTVIVIIISEYIVGKEERSFFLEYKIGFLEDRRGEIGM
jgi:hypothetical protein